MGTESGEIEEGENNDETGKDEETGIDKGEDGGDGEDKEDSGDDDSEGEGGEGDDGAGERLDVILRENSELKRSIISQQEQLNYMTASMEKHNELLKEKGIISDDDIEQVDPNVEKMQKMQDSIEETRLTIALDSARGQDAFKDVDSIVTNSAFDLKVSELAQAYTDQFGGDLIENGQSLTNQIWAMPNPYTYMYGLIKGESPDKKSGGNSQKPVDAPGSLANTGGGVDNKGSVQAKMIDDMSEMELNEALLSGKIKQETYKAYLKGELVEK